MRNTRRICLALDLKDNPELIAEYERHHETGNVWPEVKQSIAAAGIERLEIHRVENRLVMILDVNDDYDARAKRDADAADPKVREWEDLMSTYQQPLRSAPPGVKWVEMRRICRLDADDA